MDRHAIIKKFSYTTKLNPTYTNDNLLAMLGFSQKPNHNTSHILEKLNYPTSLQLPSFAEELEKEISLKKMQISGEEEPLEEQQATE